MREMKCGLGLLAGSSPAVFRNSRGANAKGLGGSPVKADRKRRGPVCTSKARSAEEGEGPIAVAWLRALTGLGSPPFGNTYIVPNEAPCSAAWDHHAEPIMVSEQRER